MELSESIKRFFKEYENSKGKQEFFTFNELSSFSKQKVDYIYY